MLYYDRFMTLTTHAALGALIGSLVGNPFIGFFLGLVSHFLVDIIPHGDNMLADRYRVHKKKKLPMAYVTVDAAFSIIFLMIVSNYHSVAANYLAFSAAVVGSVLPDFIVGLAEIWKTKSLRAFFKFHFFIHDLWSRKHGDIRLSYALLGQAIFVLAVFNFLR